MTEDYHASQSSARNDHYCGAVSQEEHSILSLRGAQRRSNLSLRLLRFTRSDTRRCFSGDEKGFTLLEILIAVVLVLSVVLIASGALRLGQRSVASGDRKVEHLERMRSTVLVLDAQIQSMLPLTYRENDADRYYFQGDSSTLRLSTNHSLWGAEKGYVVATYRVERNIDGKMSLRLTEQIIGTEQLRETRLLDGLNEMSFSYFHKGLTADTDQWVEDWQDGTDLPRKVRIIMASGSWRRTIEVPLRSMGNLTPTAWTQSGGKS
jgi:general secretion pathway protein J